MNRNFKSFMPLLKFHVFLVVAATICLILFAHHKIPEKTVYNNACTSFSSYLNIFYSKNCYHIPDTYQNVCTIALSHVGVCEDHKVTTEDGYILTIFRLPRSNPKDVILLQHPLGVDSRVWISQYNKSTALFYWKAGYDVWMPNNRGTFYSKNHVNLTRWDGAFWDFSFHEMGLYDHKAAIDYIRGQTEGSKIIFLGHSMATTSGLIYASLRPEEAKENIKAMILLAPVAYVDHAESIFRYLSFFLPQIQVVVEVTNQHSLVAYDSWFANIIRRFAILFPFKILLVNLLAMIVGPHQFDPNYCNVFLSNIPSETSWKVIFHYGQLKESYNGFKMYDYGKENNLKIYKNVTPPSYPLSRIRTPIYLVHSKEDYLSVTEDVDLLYEHLPEEAKIYGKLEVRGFNHFDFHTGKDKMKMCLKILQFIENLR